MTSVVTFSRKKADSKITGPSTSGRDALASTASCQSFPASSFVTAQSVLTPVAESPATEYSEKDGGMANSSPVGGGPASGPAGPQRAGKWRRRAAPTAKEKQLVDRGAYLAEMRAYYQEIDQFDLAVETPSPANHKQLPTVSQRPAPVISPVAVPSALRPQPKQPEEAAQGGEGGRRGGRHAAQAPGSTTRPLRPMSLGLSRRVSAVPLPPQQQLLASCKKGARPSPLRISLAPCKGREGPREGGPVSYQSYRPSAGGADSSRPSSRFSLAHRMSMAADNSSLITDRQQQQQQQQGLEGEAAAAGPGSARRSSVTHYGRRSSQAQGLAGRRSSAANERLSVAGRMMSRLSLGLSDALHWLGVKGSVPTASGGIGLEGGRLSAVRDDVPALGGSQLSPIMASPAEGEQEQGPQHAETGAEIEKLRAQLESRLLLDKDGLQPAAQPAAAEEEAGGASTATVENSGQEESTTTGAAAVELHELAPVEAGEELSPLKQLLVLCGQEGSVLELPTMDALLGQHVDLTQVRKIGEGTFGEAFKGGRVVFKIVPMEGQQLVNGEPQKRADEILAEVAITLTLSGLRGAGALGGSPGAGLGASPEGAERSLNVTSGFVETFGVGLCRGRYAAALRKEWHRWDKLHSSENEAVDVFGKEQLFVVFVVADGGLDLEHTELRSFEEMHSVLMQVALTLAVAEESCQFEHRDLHWGNLLMQRDGGTQAAYRLRGVDIAAQTRGVSVTLIDFTLSRLVTAGGEVAFCDLSADPELFKGPKGDCQAETYRRMKKATRGDWRRHAPATNLLWMHYLADVCLTHKLSFPCSGAQKLELRNFRKRCLGYVSAAELVWDEWLRQGWAAVSD